MKSPTNFTAPRVPIVCIGLSAGGIAPLQELFLALAPDTNMAFVVIHHLRREHPTELVSILSSCTALPVQLADEGLAIHPNNVYILPSGEEITLRNGNFKMQPRSKVFGWPDVVSRFIDSLGRSRHPGIAVILSGLDADGAAALVQLKLHGGIVMAQDPSTASSPEMPKSAIATGVVDYILEPSALGRAISRIGASLPRASGQIA